MRQCVLTTTHLNVAALQSQTEACLLVFDKVQRHLRVALLLQVGNDGLTHQLGVAHHVEHLEETNSDIRTSTRENNQVFMSLKSTRDGPHRICG